MDLQKINVKFFLEKGQDIPLATFIPLFHRWIQENRLEGLLVDVAEYTHVHQGPGVLLIAHEANYSVDEENGKRGLLYNQKRAAGAEGGEHLKKAFRRALQACALLEKEPEAAGKMKFIPGHFQIFINDRLEAPNNASTHEELEKELKPFLDKVYGGAKYTLFPESDRQKRAGVEVKMEKPALIVEILSKLS